MPYLSKEQIAAAREMDLMTYNSRQHIITAPFAAMRGEALWQKVL